MVELDTPSLVVDLDVMERNIRECQALADRLGVRLRPHIKTHKVPEIARMQVQAGASGICAAKVSEAEPFADAGLDDIFIANEIVGEAKARRAAQLAKRVKHLRVAIDSELGARQLSAAAAAEGVTIGVLVDLDVGLGRCGIAPGPSRALAKLAHGLPGLSLIGIMSYGGSDAQQSGDPEKSRQAVERESRILKEEVAAWKAMGLPVHEVSVGGTPSAPLLAETGVVTEIRPGTYIFMDENYARAISHFGRENIALYFLARVISRSPGRAVVDAGSKTLHAQRPSEQAPWAHVRGYPGVKLHRMWEEHGVLLLDEQGEKLQVGDLVELVPNHVCPAVNLHDTLYGVRGGKVEEVWQIAARGKVQ